MKRGVTSSQIVQFIIFIIIEITVIFLVSAITMNWIVGFATALLIFDIVYVDGEKYGIWKFVIGAACVAAMVVFTFGPMLFMFIEANIPSFMFGLEQIIIPAQESMKYLTPEYYLFKDRQTVVYEDTTDNPGVAPNIAFEISLFEVRPSSGVVFDQIMTLWVEVSNQGDEDLDVIKGFRTPIVFGQISSTSPCPCQILKSGEAWGTKAQYPVFDDSCKYVYEDSPEIDALCISYPDTCVDYLRYWSDTTDSYTPLNFSSCGAFPERTIGSQRSHSEYCSDVVYHTRHTNLSTEICQVEAYAQADLHSRGILSVQIINTSYYFQREGIVPGDVPAISSAGSGLTSISVGQQPLLDIEPTIIASVGFENGATGDIINFYQMYFLIPPGLPSCRSEDLFSCSTDSNSCGLPFGSWSPPADFVEDCVGLVNDGYTVCKLKATDFDTIKGYLLSQGFVSVACTMENVDTHISLPEYYRKSYLMRADTFYRYEMNSYVNIDGIKIG